MFVLYYVFDPFCFIHFFNFLTCVCRSFVFYNVSFFSDFVFVWLVFLNILVTPKKNDNPTCWAEDRSYTASLPTHGARATACVTA